MDEKALAAVRRVIDNGVLVPRRRRRTAEDIPIIDKAGRAQRRPLLTLRAKPAAGPPREDE